MRTRSLIAGREKRHMSNEKGARVTAGTYPRHTTNGDAGGAMPSDVSLMLRAREDEEAAFALLYGRYYRKVLSFFYAMSREPETAADLCQETFLRIWKLRKRYEATGSFAAYLFTFARYVWREKRRAAMKAWRNGLMRVDAVSWDELPDKAACRPDRAAISSELEAHVLDALSALPEEQRMAFVLRTVQGLSLDEIAAVMDCPANTVRSRRILAIGKLRQILRGIMVL